MSRTLRRRHAGHRFFRHRQVCHLLWSLDLYDCDRLHDLPEGVRRVCLARFHSDRHQWGRPPAPARRQAHHRERQATRHALHQAGKDSDALLLPAPHRHALQRIWDWY